MLAFEIGFKSEFSCKEEILKHLQKRPTPSDLGCHLDVRHHLKCPNDLEINALSPLLLYTPSSASGSGVMIGHGRPDAKSGGRGAVSGAQELSLTLSMRLRQRAAGSSHPPCVVIASSFFRSSTA